MEKWPWTSDKTRILAEGSDKFTLIFVNKRIKFRVHNSSWLPAKAGSFSTFAGYFVNEKKENKTILINELLLVI
jgi:hypothetical protein